jgi:adenine-specific DNA-methyltransferase
LERTEAMIARYKNPDNDPRGVWLLSDLAARNFYAQGRYSITTKSGKVIAGPPAGSYWRVSKERFDELDRDNRIWWGESGDNRPGIKRFLSEVRQGVVPQTYWAWKDVGSTRNAKQELSQIMGATSGEDLFITPKPTKLVERMLQIGTGAAENDVVLDFFGGSGTTGHAALIANAKDTGNRRYILVQFPEPTGDPKYPTIADLTKERLRRAGKRVREENPMFAGDLGFRVFKLASSNIQAWEPNRENLAQTLEASVEHLKTDRTEADILFELLLKLGLDLSVAIEAKIIAGKTVHSIGAGTLLVCLAPQISRDEAESLALGIADWHKAQSPAGESTVVFRDSAFADDVAKTNLSAILHQQGLENVRSL